MPDAVEPLTVGARLGFRDRAEVEARVSSRPPIPRDVQKAVERGVAIEYGRGVVQAAKVQAGQYVAHNALRALEALEAEELAAIARDPVNCGRRQRRIVDGFTNLAVDAIAAVGRVYP